MPPIENQPVTDYRGKLTDRMKSRFPDRRFEADSETDETTATNALEQSLSEEFDALDAQLNEYKEHEDQFMSLLKTSPSAARFFNSWIRNKDAAVAFRESYGTEAFAALNSPEGAEIVAEIEAKEAKKAADDQALQDEKAKNLEESFNRLDSFGDAKGLDDEAKLEIFSKLNQTLQDAEKGIYSEEFFEMAWKANHYDSDVESARKEGEVAGRNARIQDLQKGNRPRPNIVPMLNGQGSKALEQPKPKVQTEGDFWAE